MKFFLFFNRLASIFKFSMIFSLKDFPSLLFSQQRGVWCGRFEGGDETEKGNVGERLAGVMRFFLAFHERQREKPVEDDQWMENIRDGQHPFEKRRYSDVLARCIRKLKSLSTEFINLTSRPREIFSLLFALHLLAKSFALQSQTLQRFILRTMLKVFKKKPTLTYEIYPCGIPQTLNPP
jgi:hypothetical protein